MQETTLYHLFLNVFVDMVQCNAQIYDEIAMLLLFVLKFTRGIALLLSYLIHSV